MPFLLGLGLGVLGAWVLLKSLTPDASSMTNAQLMQPYVPPAPSLPVSSNLGALAPIGNPNFLWNPTSPPGTTPATTPGGDASPGSGDVMPPYLPGAAPPVLVYNPATAATGIAPAAPPLYTAPAPSAPPVVSGAMVSPLVATLTR